MSAPVPLEVTAADARRLLAVSESVGWPHSLDDWRAVLESALVFAHPSGDGEVVSSGALFPLGSALAAIGMIIVKPAHQGRGLARAMMQRCLTYLGSPSPAFMLIATPQGRPLYEHLGFEVVDHIQKVTRPPIGGAVPPVIVDGPEIVRLDGAEQDVVYRLDADAFGADRRRALAARIPRRRAGALLRRRGTVVGFGLSAAQGATVTVGPVVAPDADGAAALVLHLAAHEPSLRVDVPAGQKGLIATLAADGFERGDVAPVMLLGGRGLPGRRERLFACASRAIS